MTRWITPFKATSICPPRLCQPHNLEQCYNPHLRCTQCCLLHTSDCAPRPTDRLTDLAIPAIISLQNPTWRLTCTMAWMTCYLERNNLHYPQEKDVVIRNWPMKHQAKLDAPISHMPRRHNLLHITQHEAATYEPTPHDTEARSIHVRWPYLLNAAPWTKSRIT